ncbi:MAG: acetamidase/formamidase family protein [Lachnospiraceae bacterium]|nr:acetamidase/formamidase family protein [Candidatus Equihabitans merdae]
MLGRYVMAVQTIYVNEFTNGILGPEVPMLGPVKDGGFIVANTAAGCWGPLLTPAIRGGHEVTKPVLVEGAEPGDAIAIKIIDVKVTSKATASGPHNVIEGRYLGDPYIAGKCSNCGKLFPSTHIEGIGQDAIVCDACGAPASPFSFANGYTMAFDDTNAVGVTLNKASSESIASNGRAYMNTPENSIQNPVVSMAPHDLVGLVARTRPFLGQLGTTPVRNIPDSHNAGDLGCLLVDAPHEYGLSAEEAKDVTDGHLDIKRVRAGATLIAPVYIPGGGVYLGDMHAMQGDGEIAGHTADVCGISLLQVSVIKGLNLKGPLLLPTPEDLPYLARPLTDTERAAAEAEAAKWGVAIEESAPLSFIGTGVGLNEAINCAMERAAALLDMTIPEIKNRLTITGELEIGRARGTCTATFRVPVAKLKELGLWEMVKTQYHL